MNNTKHAKRIQSRLSSQNIKISLGDIRNKAIEMNLDLNDESSVENVFMAYMPSEIVDSIGNDELSLNPVCSEVETVQNLDTTTTTQSPPESTDLVINPQVSQMVNIQAQSMGIQLLESEVISISNTVDFEGSTFSDVILQVKNSILAAIDLRDNSEFHQISNMVSEVSQAIAEKRDARTNQLAQGLGSISNQLTAQATEQKKQLTGILSRLKVPG